MAYGKEERRIAGLKSWETRRANIINLALPDYGETQDNPDTPPEVADVVDVGAELPTVRDTLAGGIASWPDEIADIDSQGYQLMRTTHCVRSPVQKLAYRTAALDLVVVGKGARAEALQDITDQAKGKEEMVEWLTWGRVEGVRYMQIKVARSREGGDIWVVPDFNGGGRMKQKAGGSLQWDGKRIMEKFETTGVTTRGPTELPRNHFMIFRPGAGSNPEGDLGLGLTLYRIARNWNEALKNMDKFTELFGVPMRLIQRNLSKAKPTEVNSLLTGAVKRLQDMQNDRAIGLSSEDVIKLLQPQGSPLKDMTEYATYLEGLANQLLLLNTLTSDTAASGPAGSSTVHLSEEDKAVFYNAHLITQPLNLDLIPWIERHNELPPLLETEDEPFYTFQPMGQRESDSTAIADEEDLTGEMIEDPEFEEVMEPEFEEEFEPQPEFEEEIELAEKAPMAGVVRLDNDPFPEDIALADHGHVVKAGNPWRVEKRGDKYVVVKISNDEVVGTHDTEEAAIAQWRALEASEEK